MGRRRSLTFVPSVRNLAAATPSQGESIMKRRSAVLLACGLAVMPAAAQAQGFSVNEHGTCQMGRGGAGVAAPCADGSAMLFNPAGVGIHGRGMLVSAGLTVIAAGGTFGVSRLIRPSALPPASASRHAARNQRSGDLEKTDERRHEQENGRASCGSVGAPRRVNPRY